MRFSITAIVALCTATVHGQGFLLTELSQVVGFQQTMFSECVTFVQTCAPTKSSCASAVCADCTGLGSQEINSCCAEDDPVDCFISWGGKAVATTSIDGSYTASPTMYATATTDGAVNTGYTATPGSTAGSDSPSTVANSGAATVGSAATTSALVATKTGAASRFDVTSGVVALVMLNVLATF